MTVEGSTLGLNSKTTNCKDNTSTSTIAEVAGIIMEQELKPPPVDETTTMDFEVTQTTATTTDSTAGKREGIVYVAVDGMMSQLLEIRVKIGDSLPTIRIAIKSVGRNTFASCDAFQIKLFESKVQSETESINTTTGTEVTLIALETPMKDRKSTRLNSSHLDLSRMPSSA